MPAGVGAAPPLRVITQPDVRRLGRSWWADRFCVSLGRAGCGAVGLVLGALRSTSLGLTRSRWCSQVRAWTTHVVRGCFTARSRSHASAPPASKHRASKVSNGCLRARRGSCSMRVGRSAGRLAGRGIATGVSQPLHLPSPRHAGASASRRRPQVPRRTRQAGGATTAPRASSLPKREGLAWISIRQPCSV